jgi:hypothetical protein
MPEQTSIATTGVAPAPAGLVRRFFAWVPRLDVAWLVVALVFTALV